MGAGSDEITQPELLDIQEETVHDEQ